MKEIIFVCTKDNENFDKLVDLVLEQKPAWFNDREQKAIDIIELTEACDFKPSFGYKHPYPVGSKFIVVEGEKVHTASLKGIFGYDLFVKANPDIVPGMEVIQDVKRFYQRGNSYISLGFAYPTDKYAVVFKCYSPAQKQYFRCHAVDVVAQDKVPEETEDIRVYKYFDSIEKIQRWFVKNEFTISSQIIESKLLSEEVVNELLMTEFYNFRVLNPRTIRKFREYNKAMFWKIQKEYTDRTLSEFQKSVLDYMEEKFNAFFKTYHGLVLPDQIDYNITR